MTAPLFQPRRGILDAYLFEFPLTLYYRIDIPLKPFPFAGEVAKTAVRMDFIQFPVRSWRELSGREFRFPVNPEDGYIDGSIYLGHAHNPADTTRIAFEDLKGRTVSAVLDIRFDFTFEGGASELGIFDVEWSVDLECEPSTLDKLMEEADRRAALR